MRFKRLFSIFLALCMISALMVVNATDRTQSFTDVTEVDYFYNPVNWALASGVTDGTTETTFSPSDTCTIGQILTFIWRAEGSEDLASNVDKNPFMNISEDSYFYNASLFALKHNMVSSRYNPHAPCTRLDAVKFLYILSGNPSVAQDKMDNLVFKDVVGVNKRYVAWALDNEITRGTTSTTFSPYLTCTRGQIITFLYRLLHIGEKNVEVSESGTVGFSSFDTKLISYLQEKDYFASNNYMVSPVSLRTAIALAVAGANGSTKDELIKAVGFNSEDELIKWYQSIVDIVDTFKSDYESEVNRYKQYGESANEYTRARALDIANSVWINSDGKGYFTKEFLDKVNNVYKAEALEASNATITDHVNDWVSDKTHGMINRISDDLSGNDALLVNALYLKTQWYDTFDEILTHEDEFTTFDGKSVKKDFMSSTNDFWYYKDTDGSKVLSIPMRGNTYAVFVLGSTDNITDKLSKVERRQVHVELPKFTFETSFENGELVDFLNRNGAKLAFTDDADFSFMVRGSKWNIGNIIQKTRIKVQEDGLEASAATAVAMLTTAFGGYDEPAEFIANKPFSFYIYTGEQMFSGDNFAELLFYGEVNK